MNFHLIDRRYTNAVFNIDGGQPFFGKGRDIEWKSDIRGDLHVSPESHLCRSSLRSWAFSTRCATLHTSRRRLSMKKALPLVFSTYTIFYILSIYRVLVCVLRLFYCIPLASHCTCIHCVNRAGIYIPFHPSRACRLFDEGRQQRVRAYMRSFSAFIKMDRPKYHY